MEKKKNLNDKNKIAATIRKSDLILILMQAMWQSQLCRIAEDFFE